MIDRIFGNYKSTILGCAILIGCFVLVGLDKATLTEASLFIVGGFGAIFSKDKIIGKK